MKKLRNQLRKLREEKGQSVLEYIILSSLIGIFCLIGIKQFGNRLKTRINQMNNQLEQHVRIK